MSLSYLSFLGKLFYSSYLTSSAPLITEDHYPDLNGQKWLITGATGGIGFEVAKILLSRSAEVWLVGRSEEKLSNTVIRLKNLYPYGKIHTVAIDYDDLTTVKPGIEKLKLETNQLNGIIHNAGVMFVPKDAVTKQGFEETTGVNNLATQLVQDFLDPFIENTANGRIVWLSSLAHVTAPKYGFDVQKIENGSTVDRYCISKALDYILAVQWSKRHPNSTVKSVAVHPGVIKSDLTRHMSPVRRWIFECFQWDTVYGARTVANAALVESLRNNEYVVPFGRPGLVRPDIKSTAHNERGAAAVEWIESKIQPYK